jgi:hypothetical protein
VASSAANYEQDQERSPWTWRSIRDGGLGFLISICIFAATASIVSALLKSPLFSKFFDLTITGGPTAWRDLLVPSLGFAQSSSWPD